MSRFCTLIVLILVSSILNANGSEVSGFEGCGHYLLRGTLLLDKEHKLLIYSVNHLTKSELVFSIPNKNDLNIIAGFLNKSTAIKADILKKMDGTKGEIQNIKEVDVRYPNPLSGPQDTYIRLLQSKSCKH